MANSYKHPGVYIEEIPTFPPSIAQVETAIPAFIGYTEKATRNGESLDLKPTRITSLLEFEQYFGGPKKEESITVTVKDTLDGTVLKERTITVANASPCKLIFYYAMQLFFNNGGGPCYIVSAGQYGSDPAITEASSANLVSGIKKVAGEDEPTLIVIPEAAGLSSGYADVYQEALNQSNLLQDRFTLIDVPVDSTKTLAENMDTFRAFTLPNLKYGAAYYPYLKTSLNYYYLEADVDITHTGGVLEGKNLEESKSINLELYNQIKKELPKLTVTNMPPGSSVAGVYATVDRERGVWKAPANVPLNSIIGPVVKINDSEQDYMNVDPAAGKSVNAIRAFTGKGILVWGARTLAGNDNEWKYIPVRRFYNFAEESIKKGTGWVVFEPNDANTWVRVKAMIENFLTLQWRAGALAGAKPADAFFVNVGLGVTMSALDILEGRMNIEIGMAVVRPAEFIILKFSHIMQKS